MFTKSMLVAILAAASGIGAFQLAAVSGQEQQKTDAADRQIREAAAAYAETFSKGDMDAVIGFWADDADYLDVDGNLHRGKSAIADLFKKNAANCKDHKMSIEVASVKSVKPDVVLEEGTVTIQCPTGEAESNKYIAIWTKTDDRWKLSSVRDQESKQTPAPETEKEPLQELAWLVGDWTHESGKSKAALKCRWRLNKRYLTMEYEVKKPNEEPTQVAVWIGWDPGDKELRSWVFDSEGGNAGARWERYGNTWKSQCDGVLCDGRFGASLNTIELVDDRTFVWSSKDRRIDGESVGDAEAKFTKSNETNTDAVKETN
jgi:uncharacterized protein (TIGR02246 family)